MKDSRPPIPIDPQGLVALKTLYVTSMFITFVAKLLSVLHLIVEQENP